MSAAPDFGDINTKKWRNLGRSRLLSYSDSARDCGWNSIRDIRMAQARTGTRRQSRPGTWNSEATVLLRHRVCRSDDGHRRNFIGCGESAERTVRRSGVLSLIQPTGLGTVSVHRRAADMGLPLAIHPAKRRCHAPGKPLYCQKAVHLSDAGRFTRLPHGRLLRDTQVGYDGGRVPGVQPGVHPALGSGLGIPLADRVCRGTRLGRNARHSQTLPIRRGIRGWVHVCRRRGGCRSHTAAGRLFSDVPGNGRAARAGGTGTRVAANRLVRRHSGRSSVLDALAHIRPERQELGAALDIPVPGHRGGRGGHRSGQRRFRGVYNAVMAVRSRE